MIFPDIEWATTFKEDFEEEELNKYDLLCARREARIMQFESLYDVVVDGGFDAGDVPEPGDNPWKLMSVTKKS